MKKSKYGIKEEFDVRIIEKRTGKIVFEAKSTALELMNASLRKEGELIDEAKVSLRVNE